MKRRWLSLAAALLLAAAARGEAPARAHTLTGEFRAHPRFHSRFLLADRDVLVSLPPGYDSHPKERYPVLYLQDGQNVFDGATSFIAGQEWRVDETAQALMAAGTIRPLLIVGVYNGGLDRLHEYTPGIDARYPQGGGADAYGPMLVEELKPFIDRTYRTRTGPDDTGLGGSSLGALVSLYLGLKHPDVFGRIAVLSPSVWWNDRSIVREVGALAAKLPLRVWLDVGTAESPEALPDVRLLRDALVAKEWRVGRDLGYFEAEGARHNEAAWARRVGPMLTFLFPAAPHAMRPRP